MKKLLLAACLLIMSHGFSASPGLAQSTITIGDTNIEAVADGNERQLAGGTNKWRSLRLPPFRACHFT